MQKLFLFVQLGISFFQKYAFSYVKLLIKPALLGLISCIFIPLCYVYPICAIPALLISIPCVCYAFWRGFLITYSLNYAALDFIKEETHDELKNYYLKTKAIEKNYALYVGFCAILSLIFYIPTLFYVLKQPLLQSAIPISSTVLDATKVSILNTLFFFPFLNYLNQTYFFRKEKETFVDAVLNCYRKLDIEGIIIALFFVFAGMLLSAIKIYGIALAILLNVLTYSINTFWYYLKEEEEKEEEEKENSEEQSQEEN